MMKPIQTQRLTVRPVVALFRSLGFAQIGTEQVSFYQDAAGNDLVFEGGVFEKLL